ncbi:MAG TPA: DUF1015 domain-containing protein [Ruminococcaceae bacterium]|nr:DUF1015 domain-containing protein [Oscillospiraceae bacterium]
MAVFKAFSAVRPLPEYASQVAALPYDVMNSKEAAIAVEGNPNSFLHVDKAEIDLPDGTDLYSDAVYQKASENLRALVEKGVCQKDDKPCFFLYRQIMDGRSQTGVVGCASIDDYINNRIKKHEHTREEKEQDRIRHVDTCNAHTGPIFLTYKNGDAIQSLTEQWKAEHEPIYDFSADNVEQTVWVIDDESVIAALSDAFSALDCLYIADGHHRCASAVKVGLKRREENPHYTGEEEFNFFLAVSFPCEELAIMDYNRVICDLNGLTLNQLLTRLSESFSFRFVDSDEPFRPNEKHTFGMFCEGKWYCLTAKEGTFDENDPVARLDVSILQNNLIAPILGITDPRTDARIDFVGGIRGLKELERRAESDMRLAFSMYPTTLDDLTAIADAGMVMPPKSTWFEPKLLSGLFIHEI